MLKHVCVIVIVCSLVLLWAERSQAQAAGCPDAMAVVKQTWQLERQLSETYRSKTPATDARKLAAQGEEMERRLSECETMAMNQKDAEKKALLEAERLNLQLIDSFEISYGGLKLFGDDTFHDDLGILAPACKDVISTRLAERIEQFDDEHRNASTIRMDDVEPLYSEVNAQVGAGLVICAMQADNAGYKDTAKRLMTDALQIENLAHIAVLNGNKP
jgi:hypothetical protein